MTELQHKSLNAVTISEWTAYDMINTRRILNHLREIDRYELAAFGLSKEVAIAHVKAASDAWLVKLNGEPVFIAGTIEPRPGFRSFFGFGTDKTSRIMPTFTRFCKEVYIPELFANGMRRGQAQLPLDCVRNWQWLIDLGFTPEATMREFGANGETFIQLALFEECLER